jgi:hypothetical protein
VEIFICNLAAPRLAVRLFQPGKVIVNIPVKVNVLPKEVAN